MYRCMLDLRRLARAVALYLAASKRHIGFHDSHAIVWQSTIMSSLLDLEPGVIW